MNSKRRNFNGKKRIRPRWGNIIMLLIIVSGIIYVVYSLLLKKEEPIAPEEPTVVEYTFEDLEAKSIVELTEICTQNKLDCIFELVENDEVDYGYYISHDKGLTINVTEQVTFNISKGEHVSLATEGYSDIDEITNPTKLDALVNKNNQLPSDYEPEGMRLPKVFVTQNNRILREVAASAIELLITDIKEEGYNIGIASAYRSYDVQEGLYNNYVNRDGKAAADTYSARPGHSEHQTGLALDWCIPNGGKCPITSQIKTTDTYKWMMANMHKYGFILSYPEGNKAGYVFEPWHIRYVGIELATYLFDEELTLDEYYELGKELRKPLD